MDKLKDWVINNYKASVINVSTHQKLPLVSSSPPLRLYVDPKVQPVVCNKPGTIPLHLQARVKAGLDKDLRLSVIWKLPPNAPVNSYLHRLVIAKKTTGKSRRTVDLRPLGRACPWQTHSVEPPFLQQSPSQELEGLPQRQGRLPLHPHPQRQPETHGFPDHVG